MSPSLPNRPTEPIDLHGVAAQLTLCTPVHACMLGSAFAGMQPWQRYPFSAAALEAYLAGQEAGAPRYCLLVDGEPAGALGLRLNWLRGPYIQFLGVLPRWQQHGYGAAILQYVIALARANTDRNLWVAASSFNAPALRFYEAQGFARVALIDDLIQDGIDEVLLRKRL